MHAVCGLPVWVWAISELPRLSFDEFVPQMPFKLGRLEVCRATSNGKFKANHQPNVAGRDLKPTKCMISLSKACKGQFWCSEAAKAMSWAFDSCHNEQNTCICAVLHKVERPFKDQVFRVDPLFCQGLGHLDIILTYNCMLEG